MIVKFHARGVGRGSGPIDYLLGKDRDREKATLDRGNPDEVQALIDSSQYAKKYTSGVLSFQEPDLDRATKDKIMSSFEQALLPGLDSNQYSCLWVEHKDKGRLELNFVVPNIELQTGKRLQPYYDKADRPRINAWKIGMNARLGLHDPDDPMNKQISLSVNDLPKNKKVAVQTITDAMLALTSAGEIQTRDDVVATLEQSGFTLARITPKSISIVDPDGGRNLRLKGALYEQAFRADGDLSQELQAASERYRAASAERIRAAQADYQQCFERKRAENQNRYKRPESTSERIDIKNMVMVSSERNDVIRSDTGRSMLAGEPYQSQLADDQRAEREYPSTGSQGRQDKTEPMWETIVYSSSEEHKELGEELGQSADVHTRGILNDDRVRKTVAERFRTIATRARETAERLYGFVQRALEKVRGEPSGKQAIENECYELNQASRTLDGFTSRLQNRIKLEQNQSIKRSEKGMSKGFFQ